MIQPTGSTSRDITTIMRELNRISDSNTFTNALKIISYGNVGFTVPNLENEVTIGSFPHSLDYAPIYFIKILGGDNKSRDFPFADEVYGYNSGTKSQGGYAFNRFLTYVDKTNIYIEVDNLPNPLHAIVSGHFVFTYYIFNRPITG